MQTSSKLNCIPAVLAGALLSLALAGCSKAADDGPQASEKLPPAMPNSGPVDTEWTLHGNDVGEQRYSELAQINRENIDQLELAWSFDMYTRRGIEATPLMVGGTLYVSGSWSMVYALDARSGELKWFYDPQVDRAFLAKGCCDAVNRGVAYADGRIFVGTYDGRLVALDAEDGKVHWGRADHRPRSTLHHHRRSPRGQGQDCHWQWWCRIGGARLCQRLRPGERSDGLALLHGAG